MCKVCSFFGHRTIVVTEELKKEIRDVVENLILNHNVRIFLFGSRSRFDDLCLSIVSQLKEKYPNIKRVCYTCQSEACYLEKEKNKINFYAVDEEFEHKAKYDAGKASYVERNQAMINDSDFCIFYYDENYLPPLKPPKNAMLPPRQTKSGTALAFAYAKRKKKNLLNLANSHIRH